MEGGGDWKRKLLVVNASFDWNWCSAVIESDAVDSDPMGMSYAYVIGEDCGWFRIYDLYIYLYSSIEQSICIKQLLQSNPINFPSYHVTYFCDTMIRSIFKRKKATCIPGRSVHIIDSSLKHTTYSSSKTSIKNKAGDRPPLISSIDLFLDSSNEEIDKSLDDWERYWDPTEKAYYLYNPSTNQSKWENEENVMAPFDSYEYPKEYECCITLSIMSDPVVASDGFSYERFAIEEWLTRCNTSPQTNEILDKNILIPNHSLRFIISPFLEQSK